MFEVGFSEIVMIALVALLVVGPERLPEMVRTTGRWIGRFKRIAAQLREEIEHDVGAQELRQMQHDFRQAAAEPIGTEPLRPAIAPPAPATPPVEHKDPGAA